MRLHRLLADREASGRPFRVVLIGAGRFGAMFLNQARFAPGIHVVGIADLDTERARNTLRRVGWSSDAVADSVTEALKQRRTVITEDAHELIDAEVDVVVEATGNPEVGIAHALRTIEAGRHIVMVNVEADALAGPALAARAERAGVVYSLAYGDQPAMTWELVDWARACGFPVVCAGKGTKYLPGYHAMNPDNVWEHWEFSEELTSSGQLNPYMHTSFRDGTKAAIEMAAVANAAGLRPADDGLSFPPASTSDLSWVCRPREAGGNLQHSGTVEVVSSVTPDGSWLPHHLQEGVFVVIEAPDEYAHQCFTEYAWQADDTGNYIALYRPQHLVGLELNVTLAHAIAGVPTGAPVGMSADVVAVAKQQLQAGSQLDGEGGYAVWGKLMPAETSLQTRALPIGLAHHVELLHDVGEGEVVRWDDVRLDEDRLAIRIRREAEALLA